MKMIQSLSFGLALMIGVAGVARAEQVPVGVVVYYGSAEYVSGGGSVVGPYSMPGDCQNALDDAITNAVENLGEVLVLNSVQPCMPRWSFRGLPQGEAAPYTLAVVADTPEESLKVTRMLLEEVRRARVAYRADEYEATLQAIAKASASK
jgi:hypothetical protein